MTEQELRVLEMLKGCPICWKTPLALYISAESFVHCAYCWSVLFRDSEKFGTLHIYYSNGSEGIPLKYLVQVYKQ